jgi:hypothetical protein
VGTEDDEATHKSEEQLTAFVSTGDSYISRYKPRKMTTLKGLVESSGKYDRYYDFVCDAVSPGILPTMTLPIGSLLLRKSDRTIEESRTIPPSASTKLGNRYSGRRLDGTPGHGALYLASLSALLREHAHYSLPVHAGSGLMGNGGKPPLWLPGSSDRTRNFMTSEKAGPSSAVKTTATDFHVYRAARSLVFADLRLASLHHFFYLLLGSESARRKYALSVNLPINFIASAVISEPDHSAGRGMADAIFDTRHKTGAVGVCATTARTDSDSGLVFDAHGDLKIEGYVYAVFGEPNKVVNDISPVESFASFKDLSDYVKKCAA